MIKTKGDLVSFLHFSLNLLRKNVLPSPNLADAFIMANFNVKNSNTVGLNANMF